MGLYTFRLIFLQLVNGDDFKAKATNTTDYKFTVTAARGDIVDSTGKMCIRDRSPGGHLHSLRRYRGGAPRCARGYPEGRRPSGVCH